MRGVLSDDRPGGLPGQFAVECFRRGLGVRKHGLRSEYVASLAAGPDGVGTLTAQRGIEPATSINGSAVAPAQPTP